MKSGHIVILLLVILVAGVTILAIFLWQKEHAEETRAVNEQLRIRYEATADSLDARIRELETRVALSTGPGDTVLLNMLFDEIDFLRRQVIVVADSAVAASGLDSVTFFIRRLGDSTFVTHYGDYGEAKKWYIAPEALGMIGQPAIASLLQHLDGAQGFELSQTLYALRLASQHESVRSITRGRMPSAAQLDGDAEAAIRAWKEWGVRYNFIPQ